MAWQMLPYGRETSGFEGLQWDVAWLASAGDAFCRGLCELCCLCVLSRGAVSGCILCFGAFAVHCFLVDVCMNIVCPVAFAAVVDHFVLADVAVLNGVVCNLL